LSGFVNDPDLTDSDAFIGANSVVTSGRTVECDIVLRGSLVA
jgi:hypothetical protein